MGISASTFGPRKVSRWRLLACALAIFCAVGCERQTISTTPAHLIGIWKTEDPRYRGLFLEITGHSVTFNTAEGGLESYRISKTESSVSGKNSAHVIYGVRDGDNIKFQFYYENAAGERLRFKNQLQIAWSKVHDGGH